MSESDIKKIYSSQIIAFLFLYYYLAVFHVSLTSISLEVIVPFAIYAILACRGAPFFATSYFLFLVVVLCYMSFVNLIAGLGYGDHAAQRLVAAVEHVKLGGWVLVGAALRYFRRLSQVAVIALAITCLLVPLSFSQLSIADGVDYTRLSRLNDGRIVHSMIVPIFVMLFFLIASSAKSFRIIVIVIGCITIYLLGSGGDLVTVVLSVFLVEIFRWGKGNVGLKILFVCLLGAFSILIAFLGVTLKVLKEHFIFDTASQRLGLVYQIPERFVSAFFFGDFESMVSELTYKTYGNYVHNLFSAHEFAGILALTGVLVISIINGRWVARHLLRGRGNNDFGLYLGVYVILSVALVRYHLFYPFWVFSGYVAASTSLGGSPKGIKTIT